MMRFVIILLSIVIFTACSDNKKDILPPLKMQEVLWDYVRADVFTTDFVSQDSSKNLSTENVKIQKAIFEKHKTTKEIFYNSYRYYEAHPVEFRTLIDTLIVRKRLQPVKIKPEKDTNHTRKVMSL